MESRNSEVAGAALWMHLNRGAGGSIKSWSSATIVTACGLCKSLHESKEISRTYTPEDLRKAYRAAWELCGEGYNGERGPFAAEGTHWAVERDEALARI